MSNQLRELSALLGLEVVAVEDRLSRRTSRKRGPFRWVLDVRSPAGGTWRLGIFDSTDYRRVSSLNFWVQRWGRDLTLPALTQKDGRRALRLMHEAVEVKDAEDDQDVSFLSV